MSNFGIKSTKPENLSPFALLVFDTLSKYTTLPWPVMLAQCRRGNVDPVNLTPAELATVVDYMADAVGRFTSPEKAEAVWRELRGLAR